MIQYMTYIIADDYWAGMSSPVTRSQRQIQDIWDTVWHNNLYRYARLS